ncbi:hypothetical protein [Chitinophaga sp. sic0106]|uniref:hypothetical protein n=1 Tax=Chitinophaga sp. sic0106 TaxID=2854785 RepID=UPI001C437AC2|nr:hypothetical protein [Chitinophaga sp. sic0106]MBV7531338.1 hypothetical protein [Chitinophaga sp. sic0106]
MHHTQKKKFEKMLADGGSIEQVRVAMEEANVEEDEIAAFLSGEGSLQNPGESQTDKQEADQSGHPTYEMWKMEVSYESGSPVLEKAKKIKDIKIDDNRAARLNLHRFNTKIEYFKK